MSIPCETELLLRIKENARLQVLLSTALSEKSAYRDAVVLLHYTMTQYEKIYRAANIARAALEKGPEVISEEAWLESEINEVQSILTMIPPENVIDRKSMESRLEQLTKRRKPEEPVGREVTREELADAIMDSGDLAVFRVADHLLKTFRVERR